MRSANALANGDSGRSLGTTNATPKVMAGRSGPPSGQRSRSSIPGECPARARRRACRRSSRASGCARWTLETWRWRTGWRSGPAADGPGPPRRRVRLRPRRQHLRLSPPPPAAPAPRIRHAALPRAGRFPPCQPGRSGSPHTRKRTPWPTASRRPGPPRGFSPIWPAIFLIDLANSSDGPIRSGVNRPIRRR